MGAGRADFAGLNVGIGDQLLGSGLARGAFARGKRIAFGDGKKLIWDQHSAEIFRGNRNICFPGQERSSTTEWIAYHRGNRIYNKSAGDHWEWNYDFRPMPGEVFFTREEEEFGRRIGRRDFVVIEPNVPDWKACAPNKDWPLERYDEVASRLTRDGHLVIQFGHVRGRKRLQNATMVSTPSFRHALSLMAQAALYIGPEGGLHHGAAASKYAGGNDGRLISNGIPAVVLFGGFVPPQVLGYDTHTNLTGTAIEACGMFNKCEHCIAAMQSIEVEEVLEAALNHLQRRAA